MIFIVQGPAHQVPNLLSLTGEFKSIFSLVDVQF